MKGHEQFIHFVYISEFFIATRKLRAIFFIQILIWNTKLKLKS